MLMVSALVLLTVDYRVRGADSRLRGVVSAVAGPVERGLAAAVRPVRTAFGNLGQAGEQRARADRLQQQVGVLQRQLAAGADAQRTAATLARLRLLADKASFSILPARVIAAGGVTGSEQVVDVDAGTEDGVRPGQAVIVAEGLAGVVSRAATTTATIRLVSDASSVVGARLEHTRALGTVTGTGSVGRLTLDVFDPTVPIQTGDRVVTYGSADYAGGIPIGVVTGATSGGVGQTRRAGVQTFAQLGRLDLVGIVVRHAVVDSGDRLLPPRSAS